jgi:hypothetical protein
MHENKTAPTVRVVFVCMGCSAPFEATQINRPSEGSLPLSSAVTRCIFGQVSTTIRTGNPYEDYRAEKNGRGRLLHPKGRLGTAL